MPRIGIVLAGGASKGIYEIGCIRAIEEYFGKDSICNISAASIGTLIGYSYGVGQLDALIEEWKSIDVHKSGRFILSYSGNTDLLKKVRGMIKKEDTLPFELHSSVWNFSAKKIEYIPFHRLNSGDRRDYMCAALAIPIFNKGVVIKDDVLFDGAFLDNIPVYPLLEKNLDYIFCIYFDGQSYLFENHAFDRKIIKLYRFPNRTLDTLTYNPKAFDDMLEYGYKYTKDVISKLFNVQKPEDVYANIKKFEAKNRETMQKRLTTDVVLSSINEMTTKYSKRLSKRQKL